MLSSGIEARLAAQQADTSDMVRFKQEMDGLKNRLAGDSADTSKKLRDACEKFEAVFIGKLWKEMRNTVPKEGYLHSKHEDKYISMFDREFSEKMAASGGIGLADMMYDQLSEKLKNISKTTLSGGVEIKPLEPKPISLDKGMGKDPIPLAAKQDGMTLEQWGGQAAEADAPETVDETAEAAVSSPPLNDVEVKARLETLARHLEAERIKTSLLGTGSQGVQGYGSDSQASPASGIGRKIADNG